MHPGMRVSLVADIEFHNPKGALCRSVLFRQPFVLQASVDKSVSRVAVLGALFSRSHLGYVLTVDDPRFLLMLPPVTADDMYKLKETCCGLGALGCGAQYVGWEVLAVNDIQAPFCKVHQGGKPAVIEGDIGKLSTVVELFEAYPRSTCVAFGFSCQPFSHAGDQRAGHDERAMSLPHALFFSWVTQAPAIVIECVCEAASSAFVKKVLQAFTSATRYEKSETIMDLSSMWPSKRKRWWLVLTAPRFGKVSIEALPSLPEQPTINDLFPEFLKIYGSPAWDDYVLSDDELRLFHQYAKNFEDLILDPARIAPTALHAWGNQTRPCACGCRPPFSHRRLSERGLFGALVREQTPHGPMIRHVTATEVALLNGYPMGHSDHPGRLLLAGVGQLASPVHSELVFACLHRQFRAGNFDVVKPIEAREAIAAICNDVLTLRDKWFGRSKSASMTMFEERLSDLLGFPIGCHSKESSPPCGEPADEGQGVQTNDEVWVCPFLDCPLKDDQIEPVVPEVANRTLFAEVISPTVKYSILPLPDHHFQATGAISGFRMPKRKMQDPVATPVPQSGDLSELQTAPVIPIPQEPVSQDGVSQARLLKPFVRASAPEEFVDSSIGIIRVCDNSVHAIKTKGTISVASFLRAETAISGCRGQVFDILGCRLTDEALLDPGSFYVYAESDQIPEAMTSRITWLSANGTKVAVDEMEFYIRTVSTTFKMPWVSPMLIEDLASMQTISAAWLSEVSGALDESGVVSAILANGHWTPVIAHQAPHGKTRFIVTQAGASLWPSLFDQHTS